MAINIYEDNISNLLIGESSVTSVYVGSDLVYSSTPTSDYLNFTAVGTDASIGMSGNASPNVSYSFDKNTWTTWNYSTITIPSGSTVYMKGNNPNGFSKTSYSKRFTMTGSIAANGSVQSLVYGDDFENNLTFPTNYCFHNLFSGCTSLTTPPQLPATTLTQHCYENMFYGCTSLTTAPQLPATTLTISCYYSMFRNCTNLTSAPILPAATLTGNCYNNMFNGCTNLSYIKAMFTTTPTVSNAQNWVQGVASNGTFVKNVNATWDVSGVNGIPNGWTVETAYE